MLSLHIGVVTTDVGIAPYQMATCVGNGDDGVLQNGGGACPIDDDRFIIDVTRDGETHTVNYQGALEDAFRCIAAVGARGCGLEQPLESMKRALIDQAGTENAGFLRPDAHLAVIVISDEDDCSAADPGVFGSDAERFGPWHPTFRCQHFGLVCDQGPPAALGTYTGCVPRPDSYIRHPQEFVDLLLGLKDDPSMVYVSTLSGNPKPFRIVGLGGNDLRLGQSCRRPATATTPVSWAAPAVRLRWFTAQFTRDGDGARSICDDDFPSTMTAIGEELAARMKPCLSGDLDTRDLVAAEPGLQLDCQVSSVHHRGLSDESDTPIARCPMSAGPSTTGFPCWWVETDVTACGHTPTNLAFHVEQGDTHLPGDTTVVVACLHAP